MRKILLTLASFALLGCGDSTGPVASAEGTWQLHTIDGSPLPYTESWGASPSPPYPVVYRREIVSDVIIAHGDGTYNETFTIRETQGTSVTTTQGTDAGTWSQNNAALTITSSVTGSVWPFAISGNTITVDGFRLCPRLDNGCHPDVVGVVMVYTRQ